MKEEIYNKYLLVYKTDIKGVITYVNELFCNVSGYTEYELIGQNYNIIQDVENQNEILEELYQRLENEKEVELNNFSYKAKDGTVYYTDMTIFALYEDDSLVGYEYIAKNVTERIKRKKLANENLRLNRQLNSTKNDLLTIFTHELKTPLNSIINFSDIISRTLKKPLNEKKILKLIELSNKINSNGLVQLDMINTLMQIANIKSGNITVNKKQVFLKDIIEPVIKEQGINTQIETILDIGDIKIFVDKKICTTIFTKIYLNAIRYAKSKILISAKGANDTFKILIENDGEPIPKEKCNEIFELFTQLDNNDILRKQNKSTGMGLYIVRLLADLSNIQVFADKSQTLCGASFTIWS